jgi:hypothetical protein
VAYFFPEKHKGVVLIVHTFESQPLNLLRSVELQTFARDLVAAGYGIVVLQGNDRARKTWDLHPNAKNADVQHGRSVVESLTRRGRIAAAEPLYAVGIGGGGNFVTRLAFFLGCRAEAVFLAAGSPPARSQVPTIWLMAQNDEKTKVAKSGDPLALDHYGRLRERGVPARYNINDPSPVYPLRFARIPGIDAAASLAIYRALKENGLLDARDYLKESPETSRWAEAIPKGHAHRLNEIQEQLEVCYSGRRFYSDLDHRVIEFFAEPK